MKIEVQKLSYSYSGSDFQLRVPELSIAEGERVALTGPSGCGKTTLLRLLAGIYLPMQGSLRVDDGLVAEWSDRARRDFRITRIGFVFQDFRLLDYLNVRENIRLPYRLNRILRWDDAAAGRLERLAEMAGISEVLQQGAGNLSHGQQQRVGLCRAMITEPSLLLADEPTGNLDARARDQVMDLLLEEVARRRMTLVMVTHDHSLVDRFDRAIDAGAWSGKETVP